MKPFVQITLSSPAVACRGLEFTFAGQHEIKHVRRSPANAEARSARSAACDGDARAAVCALTVAKGLLEAELNDGDAERIRTERIKCDIAWLAQNSGY